MAQHFGDLGQPAGADAVDAFLVLLHLLKGHAELIGERRLRQAAREPLDSDPVPHFDIDRIRPLH
jgi:hypothetical protein